MSRSARWLLLLIISTAALRLGAAAALGLGIDESYMVAAGRVLRWGYFDHPPLSWWLARGAALLAGSEAAIVVRLPFIALFALSTWLVFRLGERMAGARAGLWAAAALNASPVFGLTTGSWVLPDGPLIAALLGGGLLLMRALDHPAEQGGAWREWLGAGGCLGLALLSKYTAVLAPLGLFGFLLTSPAHRPWLRRPQPWAGMALALALFAPVPAWNATHGWASFAFQGGRAAANRLHPFGPLAVLAGSALFLLPWIWAGLAVALVRGARARGDDAWRGRLLIWLGLPPLVLFPVVALWSRHVLFHWMAPGYLFLFPLLGAELARLEARHPRPLRAAALATLGLIVVGLGAVGTEARWNWIACFDHDLDPALQARDWHQLPAALAKRALLGGPHTVIAGTSWWFTGKLDYALAGREDVLCLDRDSREYHYLFTAHAHDGDDVVVIVPQRDAKSVEARYGRLFARMDALPPLQLPLDHRAPTSFALFLGHDFHARLEAEGSAGE